MARPHSNQLPDPRPEAPGPAPASAERRILVLAPTGNDALLANRVFANAGIAGEICRDAAQVCREMDSACGAVLLAEEVLKGEVVPLLVAALGRQPAWSDVPVIIITSGGEADQARLRRLGVFGPGSNVTLLERPFRPGTLISTVEVALRSRLRQYQVRDLLQSMQASEAQVSAIINHSPIGVCLVDSDLFIRQINPKARPLFGDIDDLGGRSFAEVVHRLWSAENAREIEARFRHTLATGESYAESGFAQVRPDRTEREYFDWEIHRIMLPDGRYGVVCYFIDVSAHVAAREKIREARDNAERANRAKDDFLAALSHELRTPLNPVLLLATEAAGNPDLAPEVRANFDMIAKNVLLEAHLIDDLLDLTRITRGKLVLDSRPVAVHAILRDAMANVKAEVAEKQLTLTIDFARGNPIVVGDSVRLQQVFWNILKNAAKFTGANGRITVTTRTDSAAGAWVVDITDTGTGMSPVELSRIFDAFAQGDHAGPGSAHRFGGLGLGLAISRSLVELHAGSIRATSPGLGQGSTFTIELPLAPAPAAAEPVADSRLVRPRASNPSIPGMRILLVEDHGPTRTVLAHLLRSRNHRVVTASSVGEARAAGTTQDFDLLITDIGLPDGDGYELMEELGRLRHLKGIALTGYGAEQDLERAQKAGFLAHLTKPVAVRTLDGVLDSVMTAVPESAPPLPPA